MFNIFSKGRYINSLFNGSNFEVVLFEDPSGSKIVIQLDKENPDLELIKSGNWVMAKFYARARSKFMSNGNIFFETKIYLEKARELFQEEIEAVKKEFEASNKENIRKKDSFKSSKAELLKAAAEINSQVRLRGEEVFEEDEQIEENYQSNNLKGEI
jgi:hypothetical protein